MAKKIRILLAILLCSTGIGAQTPFLKSNTNFKSNLPKLDSVNINFEQNLIKIAASVKSLEEISKTDTKFIAGTSIETLDSLKKKYLNGKTGYSIDSTTKTTLHTKLLTEQTKLKKAKDSKQVKELNEGIEKIKEQLRILNERIEKGEENIKQYKVEIEAANKKSIENEFKNYQLQNQIVHFKYEKYQSALNDLTKNSDEISAEVQSLEKSLGSMGWIENKILDSSDNKIENKLSISMGAKGAEASQAIEAIKKPLPEITKKMAFLKLKADKIAVLVELGANESIRPGLLKEFASIDSIDKIIETDIAAAKTVIETNILTLRNIQAAIVDNQNKMTELYKKYATKKDSNDNNLEAIAGITQPLGKTGQLVPNITLLGFKSTSDENSSTSSQLKLFVGGNTEQQKTFNSNYKLFIPEMSTFGFAADFSLGFIPSIKTFKIDSELRQPIKKLGINLGTYYLGKNLNRSKDSTEFNIGILQFKTGLQYILIGKVLSVYANVNSFFITNGLDSFKESFAYDKKLVGFVDFGLECYLDIVDKSKGGGLFIDLDLGFISAGGDVKNLVPGTDPLIPRIRIGLVKGFKF